METGGVLISLRLHFTTCPVTTLVGNHSEAQAKRLSGKLMLRSHDLRNPTF
ncbi:MAG: hypothetical protein RLP02_11610 [Coleofasciculus sp. C2-GNP5-27]